jgi:lipid A ethanolaminephosphotransferase
MPDQRATTRSPFRLRGPEVSVETLALAAGFFFALLCNASFFGVMFAGRDWWSAYTWVFAGAAATLLALLHVLVIAPFLTRWTAKPLLTVLIAASPAAVYFMGRYGVVYDTDMMRNLFHTDRQEAVELLTPTLAAYVLVLGFLPIALIWWVRIRPVPVGRAIRRRIAFLAITAVVTAAVGLPFTKDIFATARNNRALDHMLVPASVLVSGAKAIIDDGREIRQARIPIGLDAAVASPVAERRRPRLLVVVVGETVRAMNWGLNGYARQTTPELAKLDVINFPSVTSCGTATEVSVPCMFSSYGRRNYDQDLIRSHQGLLHVLDRAGIATLWRDNQSGCKGACEGLPVEQLSRSSDPRWCVGNRCFDDILLEGLDERIGQAEGDLVVVLHQLGNHGPTYFERYPAAYRRFEPTCDTAELGDCDVDAVVNTYDNAILYTDHFLGRVIAALGKRDDRDTAMVYVSDHGESLGEYGLYLHGMPWPVAPAEQTRVPMVMWFSDSFAKGIGLDRACLSEVAKAATSHDALFSTVLGMMGVSTALYDRAYDLTASCRRGPATTAAASRPVAYPRT